MDVEYIRPGQDFAQAIDRTIAAATVVLVIIGPRWMEILRSRSGEPEPDYVRHEIEAAIKRKSTIIPVLVGGASIAELTGLPDTLASLQSHQAAELHDATFKEDCVRLAEALEETYGLGTRAGKKHVAHKRLWVWVSVAAAIIIITFAAAGPLRDYRQRNDRVGQLLETAQAQTKYGEYESAFQTSQNAAKVKPGNRDVLDRELQAAMLWLRNFHVIVREDQRAEDIAAPQLAEIMSVLDAGLARSKGDAGKAASVLAHLGWAHWLNQHIAEKEFGDTAERDLREALKLDPSNVFANAMLGNWLLQTHGNLEEALKCFDIAVKSKQERPWVRGMQLGGMIGNQDAGVRRELIRVANQMRTNAEPISDAYRQRALSNYSPGVNSWDELKETLAAVSPDNAWATYLWLDGGTGSAGDSEQQRFQREFIHCSILSLADRRTEALTGFRTLQHELQSRGYQGRLADHVSAAIKRLTAERENSRKAS